MNVKDPIPLEDLHIGRSAEIVRLVDDAAVRAFAEVSGDYNPLHLDEDYARRTPFRGRIAHGALIASFISGVLGNELPGPGRFSSAWISGSSVRSGSGTRWSRALK